MEYVQGHRLTGPLPCRQALEYACEIAGALAHAHSRGVVHRDLKPANIMVSKAGVKVLDFGLAQLAAVPGVPAKEMLTKTRSGVVMGTPRYMAPEQMEGQQTGPWTDIYAFGLVLSEMLTGSPVFDRARARGVPASVARLLEACLSKDPAERWQSARDLIHALSGTGQPELEQANTASSALRRWKLGAAALAVLTALAVVRFGSSRDSPLAQPLRFDLGPPTGATFGVYDYASISPDGRQLAFTALGPANIRSLYVRPTGETTARLAAVSEGALFPCWSPDGQHIAFLKGARVMRASLKDLAPAPVVAISSGGAWGLTWGADDTILISAAQHLFRVPAGGGELRRVDLAPPDRGRYWPQFLGRGKSFIYYSSQPDPAKRGIYLAALDSDRPARLIALSDSGALFVEDRLLFVRGSSLFAQRFDPDRGAVSGAPIRLLDSVATTPYPTSGLYASFSATPDLLIWRDGADFVTNELAWVDRGGRRQQLAAEAANYSSPALSPDGARIAVGVMQPNESTRDLWVLDTRRGSRMRLTFHPADDLNPIWSPDGSRIAFSSDRNGVRDLFVKRADGVGEEEPLLVDAHSKSVEAWSADGRFLVFNDRVPGGNITLKALGMQGDRPRFDLPQGSASEEQAALSPDGMLLAYRSIETGNYEIYVRGFAPQAKPREGRWQISIGGGAEPQWRADGKELYFVSGSSLMATGIRTGPNSFEASPPVKLFDAPLAQVMRRNRYVAARDGQRFLLLARPDSGNQILRVLTNWSRQPGR